MTTSKSLINNSEEKKVLDAICSTVRKSPHVRAFLFGSRARRDANNDSDWDILLLVDKDKITKEDYDSISYPLFELGWALQQQINPVLYTEKEWQQHKFTPFYKNVTEESIVL